MAPMLFRKVLSVSFNQATGGPIKYTINSPTIAVAASGMINTGIKERII